MKQQCSETLKPTHFNSNRSCVVPQCAVLAGEEEDLCLGAGHQAPHLPLQPGRHLQPRRALGVDGEREHVAAAAELRAAARQGHVARAGGGAGQPSSHLATAAAAGNNTL